MNGRQSPDAGGEMSHTRRAMHALRWVGAARFVSQCVTWGLTAFTVRVLQPHDYGIVATSGLFTVLAGLLMDGGLSVVLISRGDLSHRIQGVAATGVLIFSVILGSAIALTAPLGAAFFRNPSLENVLRVSALQLPLSALAVVPLALLSRQMNFRRIAVVQTLASILQGALTLAMAYAGAAYWALIYGTLFGTTMRAAGLWAALHDKPTLNWRLWELQPMLRNSAHIIGQRLLYFLSGDLDTLLLGRMGGAGVLGPYSLSKTLSHAALDQVSGIVNQVTLPSFAAKSGDHHAQVNGLTVVISAAAAVVFPVFWLIGTVSPLALPLMFGARWNAMVFPFVAFSLMLPLRTIYALTDAAVAGTGNTSTVFKNMIVWALIMMPLLFAGAYFGANAAAAAWAIGFPLVFLGAMWRISRIFRTELRLLLRPLVVPAVCSAASCIVVGITGWVMQSMLPPVVLLTLEMVLSGACYWILMKRYGRSHYDQVMSLTSQLIVGR